MSFAKGLSAHFVSTPLASLSVAPSAVSSGSDSTLRSAAHSSGFSSMSAIASQPSHSLVSRYRFLSPLFVFCYGTEIVLLLRRTLMSFI